MKPFSCKQADLLISFIIDNEPISESDRKLLDEHLTRCDKCRNELHQLQQVNTAIKRTLFSKVSQHITIEELGNFVDNQIENESDKIRIKAHLEQCEECQDVLNELQQLNELRSTYEIKIPSIQSVQEQIKEKKVRLLLSKISQFKWEWRNNWSYAIIAAGVIVILCFFIYKNIVIQDAKIVSIKEQEDTLKVKKEEQFIETQDTDEETKQQIEDTKVEDEEASQLYAANFETFPAYEVMLTYEIRSHSIIVKSPEIGDSFKGEIIFEWENVEEEPIYLKIFNNRGNEIFNIIPEGNNYHYTEKLVPGLYYWKLESEEELLYMGKFFVKV